MTLDIQLHKIKGLTRRASVMKITEIVAPCKEIGNKDKLELANSQN